MEKQELLPVLKNRRQMYSLAVKNVLSQILDNGVANKTK